MIETLRIILFITLLPIHLVSFVFVILFSLLTKLLLKANHMLFEHMDDLLQERRIKERRNHE